MKNNYEVHGDVTVIFIHHKGTWHDCIIDTEDLEKVKNVPTHWILWGKRRNNRYAAARLETGKLMLMHRLIMNTPKGKFNDHINHNGLDNRKVNLRIVTIAENNQNKSGAYITNTSSNERGVSWHTRDKYWLAYITINGKRKNLGRFENEEDAVEAVRIARSKYMPYSIESNETKVPDPIDIEYDKSTLKYDNGRDREGLNIYWNEKYKKYKVQFKIDKKNIHFGWYSSIEEAKELADKIRNQLAKGKEVEQYKKKRGSITWREKRKKWHARIWVNNKEKHVGYFDDYEEAKERLAKYEAELTDLEKQKAELQIQK